MFWAVFVFPISVGFMVSEQGFPYLRVGLPHPDSKHGYYAVTVANYKKPYKICQKNNYFLNLFRFNGVIAVLHLSYRSVRVITTITTRSPPVL